MIWYMNLRVFSSRKWQTLIIWQIVWCNSIRFYWFKQRPSKWPDHLGHRTGYLCRFLGSTWNRQWKFSAYVWFMIWAHLDNFYFHCFIGGTKGKKSKKQWIVLAGILNFFMSFILILFYLNYLMDIALTRFQNFILCLILLYLCDN